MADKEDKWILVHGCHRGTLTEPSAHDTEAEAIEMYQEHRNFYQNLGYQIWYARLTSPEGKTRTLESNLYY